VVQRQPIGRLGDNALTTLTTTQLPQFADDVFLYVQGVDYNEVFDLRLGAFGRARALCGLGAAAQADRTYYFNNLKNKEKLFPELEGVPVVFSGNRTTNESAAYGRYYEYRAPAVGVGPAGGQLVVEHTSDPEPTLYRVTSYSAKSGVFKFRKYTLVKHFHAALYNNRTAYTTKDDDDLIYGAGTYGANQDANLIANEAPAGYDTRQHFGHIYYLEGATEGAEKNYNLKQAKKAGDKQKDLEAIRDELDANSIDYSVILKALAKLS
jgi:hypothetical protein